MESSGTREEVSIHAGEKGLWSKKDRQRNHFCERNIVRK